MIMVLVGRLELVAGSFRRACLERVSADYAEAPLPFIDN